MRAIRTASAALLTATALALGPAPAALADDGTGTGSGGGNITSFGFSVTPRTVAPGGTVTLASEGCEVPSVTVTSGIFDTVTLTEGRPGTATVDLDAKPGAQYEIAFDCKGERGTTTVTVAQGPGPAPHEQRPAAHKGVKAGFGTSAGSPGLGATEVVTGAALIAGALGAAVVLTRRRGSTGGRP